MTEELRFTSSDGLLLEGVLDVPEAAAPSAAVVLCHPHPKMGGTMNAPLLLALRDELVRRDWAVLRFNFRGVGASEGEPSAGLAETADAQGALELVEQCFQGLPSALAGWSFGGAVALRTVLLHPGSRACATIAPAVVERPGRLAGGPSPESFAFENPTLVVCGSNDDQVSPEACRAWAETAGATFVELRGANHFFWAKYDVLTRTVADFLDEAVRR